MLGRISSLTFLLTLLFLFSPEGLAVGKDVCCYGLNGSGGKYTPFAGPKSASECKKGGSGFREGQTICGSSDNLDQCAYMKLPDICKKCGKHWLEEQSTCSDKSLEEIAEEVQKKKEAQEESKNPKSPKK